MPTSLQGRAQQAARQKGYRFRNLYGMLDEDFLKQCWCDIRKDAASGVDPVSAQEDEQHLDANIHDLVERLKQKRYRAKLVRRHYIPKGDGTQRPRGIPAVEEKRLQLAVARLLEAIYAQDVRRCRDGYRPKVGALEAGDTLTITRQCGRYAWVVEADIKKFFDTIDQDGMVRMVAERIDDGALRRVIRKWLKAGVLDTDGMVHHPATGTPQGGTVSPVLANVFLHYVLDRWCEKVVKQPCRGEACLIRYADDFVWAFEDQADAERFYSVLGQRREKCGLALSGAKTRLIPFSRHRQAGKTSVEFLGCEFRWGKDRKGKDHRKRRTARKKLRSALKRFTAWGKENRHHRLPELFKRLNATLRGYYNDYGVHGNAASLKEFFNKAMRILLKWLKRRSQRHSYTWQGFTAVLEHCKVARPRIVGRPKTRQAALKTSADLRKRVLLKSPVRENRTPGSVRGPSGNRRSYRDGHYQEDKSNDNYY
jgi:RNA-directed DNA polymerase